MRRFILAIILTTSLLGAGTPIASAVPVACTIIGKVLHCEEDNLVPGSGGETQQVNQGGSAGQWTSDLPPDPGPFQDWAMCTPSDGFGIGHWRQMTLRGPDGQILDTQLVCVRDYPDAEPEPVAPPQPPTREEVHDAAPIPQPVIASNPAGQGLTGLESWFWVADPGPVTASVTLRGWTVTGTLTADGWNWTTGDGGTYLTTTEGSAADPAVRHLYEAKETWQVSVTVSWTGSYTVSGYGVSFTVDDLSTERTASIDYEVIEVRSVLDDPASNQARS